MALADALATADDRVSVSELRTRLAVPNSVLPQLYRLAGQELGYATAVTWSPIPGLVDVIYTRAAQGR